VAVVVREVERLDVAEARAASADAAARDAALGVVEGVAPEGAERACGRSVYSSMI